MEHIRKKLRSIQFDIELLYCMAVIMEKLGALSKALSIVQRALTSATNKQKLYVQASRLYLKKGQVDQAVLCWKKAAGQENLGIFLYWLNRCKKKPYRGQQLHTFQWFQQPVEQNYGYLHTATAQNYGLKLLENGRLTDALAAFLQDLRENGGNAGLYFNIGHTLSKLNRHLGALVYYEKAQNSALNTVEMFNNKGYSLFMLNRFEEALACYEIARWLAPRDYAILNNLAACYVKTNQPDKAVNYLQKAAQSYPGDATLENNLAMCLEATGQKTEAVKHYDLALQYANQEEHKKMMTLNKIKCLITLHRYEEALVLCDGQPEAKLDVEWWSIRGELLSKLGKITETTDNYRNSYSSLTALSKGIQ
ncbi:TPR repeat-containing protein YrrB [Sporotomaculum syntrophicum]|uniref:TPR repeat-containing protein YrrB n=1 Tax=Sporotomaculum syntrophicum TaxID=182264 RepID=A0A9D3AXP3_9FIRM|nr:tetratricopeptide repeat protein [Sporotomaculum syntrophicum]KAF1084671.1 TPR repeat-containing protein YrrB [Sporotomaculum syntrophicum]